MEKDRYIRYRDIFEKRFVESVKRDQGYTEIHPLLKGFRNKALFFKLYSYDKRTFLTLFVSSIDKNKKYLDCRNRIGSLVKVDVNQRSIYDKYEDQFPLVIKAINKINNTKTEL